MTIFKLPDLGEGLPDAEIHEWFVKVGDTVALDQPLASMETAKAIVDVPCPQAGKIVKLFGQPGDVIKTGDPLVEFEASETKAADKGTVVGHLEESMDMGEDNFIVGSSQTSGNRVKTTPAVRMLAKKLGLDLSKIQGSGEHGMVTLKDVEQFDAASKKLPEGYEPLRGVRRAMLASMTQSHAEVVPVSIFDEADIHAWAEGTDITVRLIRAIQHACQKEPALNAWFDTQHGARKCFSEVQLGLAMDSDEGLFVPVLQNIAKQSDSELRSMINRYKKEVQERGVAADNLKGATITLSNFGKFAGRYASPIIVPPMVAIIGVGKLYQAVVSYKGQIVSHPVLPLSLSFDHRAVTGGEATRFLGAMIEHLQG